jgi:hypothetical protein
MNAREFYRLTQYSIAQRNKPTMAVKLTSRRSAKSMGNGTGQKFLKNGRVISELTRSQLGY